MLKAASLSIIIRGITLISKLVLFIYLARIFTPSEMGLYGLFNTTIGLFLTIVGINFYIFNSREILSHEPSNWSRLIRDQFAFHVVSYLVILPIAYIIFYVEILPLQAIVWFYLILILDHFSQEFYRILVTLSKPLTANIVLFCRSGVWTYVLIFMMLFYPAFRNLTSLWMAWSVSSFVSLIIAVYSLRDLNWKHAFMTSVDWNWIQKGIKASLTFLGGSLALQGVMTIDRYTLEYYEGTEAVGTYTFFANITYILEIFVDTGVTAILYPKIVAAYQQRLQKEYRRLMDQLTRSVALLALVLSALAAAFIYPVLALVHKPIYSANLPVYWILLTSAVVAVVGLIPHYGLYAKRLDKAIISSNIVGLLVAGFANLLLVPKFGLVGAALATLSGMIVMGTVKLLALNKRRMV